MAEHNCTKTTGKNQCCASENVTSENVTDSAELNSIYSIVSGKLTDDFMIRSSDGNKNYMQPMFSEVNLPGQMADVYTDKVITDEMVQRVLKPVLWMIREGKFDRPFKKK